jgi:hypothetical protein
MDVRKIWCANELKMENGFVKRLTLYGGGQHDEMGRDKFS